MPSSAQRAAMLRALGRLTARERTVLVTNRQHGMIGVQGLLDGVTRAEAQAELDRIKHRLEAHTRHEMRQPPQDVSRNGSSLAPPEHEPRLGGPALRSSGMLPASTPAGRAPAAFKEKDCRECGKPFTPKGGRQVKCAECRGEPPVAVRRDESLRLLAASAPVETPPALSGSGSDAPAELPRLRQELAAIQRQLDDFAAGIDRLLESSTNNDTRAKE